eukprot:8396042-Pyramimonas_sp.AAC.1
MPGLLLEAALAGNSLISYGCATPCSARFGRQARVLPDILALPDDAAGVARKSRRQREIAL